MTATDLDGHWTCLLKFVIVNYLMLQNLQSVFLS